VLLQIAVGDSSFRLEFKPLGEIGFRPMVGPVKTCDLDALSS
jgi:hypothetical protein